MVQQSQLTLSRIEGRRISSQEVYITLREMILTFELYPGSRFTETDLAEYFGVSRTPVREALRRLEAEHYLKVLPKQGCFVRELDVHDLVQHYQVRIELEMMSLQQACLHMPDSELKKLASDWDPLVQRVRSEHPAQMAEQEEAFHLALAAGGGNQALCRYIRDINHHIRIVRRLDFTSDDRIERTFEEHYNIVQHLLRRDLKPAHNLMRKHINASLEFVRTLTLMELARKRPGAGNPLQPGLPDEGRIT